MEVQPRCPYCNAQGIEKIVAKNVSGFSLICCRKCGAIHGVAPTMKKPKTQTGQSSSYSERRRSQRPVPNGFAPTQPPEKVGQVTPDSFELILDAAPDGQVSYSIESDVTV